MNRQQVQTTQYMCLNGKLKSGAFIKRTKRCSTWIMFWYVQYKMLEREAGVRNGKEDTIELRTTWNFEGFSGEHWNVKTFLHLTVNVPSPVACSVT